jgi:adhesin transport system membrane fusion protein
MNKQIFEGIGKVHKFFQARGWLTAPVNWLFSRWVPNETEEDIPWGKQAEHAMLEETPLRAKKLLYWIAGIMAVLLVWSAVTQIDEVTRGEGRVVPSKQVQLIQSLDGGIVTEILVREGQTVKLGDPLVRIDETRAKSSLLENQSQYISLLAKQARLQALAKGRPFDPPAEVKQQDPVVYAQEYSI